MFLKFQNICIFLFYTFVSFCNFLCGLYCISFFVQFLKKMDQKTKFRSFSFSSMHIQTFHPFKQKQDNRSGTKHTKRNMRTQTQPKRYDQKHEIIIIIGSLISERRFFHFLVVASWRLGIFLRSMGGPLADFPTAL